MIVATERIVFATYAPFLDGPSPLVLFSWDCYAFFNILLCTGAVSAKHEQMRRIRLFNPGRKSFDFMIIAQRQKNCNTWAVTIGGVKPGRQLRLPVPRVINAVIISFATRSCHS
jgi:hypothetical protein